MTDQTVIRFEPHGPADTGMPEWETIPQDILISNSPVQSGHEYFNRADGTSAGVWDCTAVEYKFAPYDVNEFMLVLEGSIDIIDKQGHVETFSAGDAFILPKGTPCTWRQTGYVRKYYVIFDTPHIETQSTAIDLKPIRVDLSALCLLLGSRMHHSTLAMCQKCTYCLYSKTTPHSLKWAFGIAHRCSECPRRLRVAN